jgi:two-component system response regulator PilR (NtrC family)
MTLEPMLEELEKKYLLKALDRTNGAKKKAAELLGMSFRSFRYRLAKFGLDSGDE